jgi:hypothetical protein
MKNMRRVHDLTGKRFGKLYVIGIDDKKSRKTYWVCKCDCGNVKSVRSDALIEGKTVSCGCRKREQDKVNLKKTAAKLKYENQKDGIGKVGGTRLYGIWQKMKKRCYDRNDKRFDRYGGRGITICEEWMEYCNFHKWAMENGYSDSLTIDRIDNNGNYEPCNCRWATPKEQARNRSSNISITIGNSTRTLMEWCEIFDLDYNMVDARYRRDRWETIDELFSSKERG